MLIYLAGPIRPTSTTTMRENIDAAKKIALELWKMGHAVICPHANTDLPIELAEKELHANIWLQGDLVMLYRCDAMVVCPNWKESYGTKGEIEYAKKNNIPVYFYPAIPEVQIDSSNN